MVKINVLKFIHFGGLSFPHLKLYCSFSCRASVTSLGTPGCWQIFKQVHSTPCLVQSSGRLWDGTRVPHSQLLLQLPPTAFCKTQSCSPAPNICNWKLRRACNWGLLLCPKHPGLFICDSPLYPSGNLYYCFVNLDFLLVLSTLIAITAIVGRKKEAQIYSIVNIKRIWPILPVSE